MISDEIYTGDSVYKVITDALFTGRYPAVQTIFWALIILGIFMLFITSIIAVIRLEYAPDKDKGNSKAGVVKNFFKAIFSFAVVPCACIFGMFLANSLIKVIDTATAYTTATETQVSTYYDKWSASDSKDETGELTNYRDNSYYAYNVFGLRIPTTTEPFSATIFKACAYGCNRIRNSDAYFEDLKNVETLGFLQNFEDNDPAATIIDEGFAINAKLKGTFNLNTSISEKYYSDWSGWIAFDGWDYSGLTELSKYNVNAVYYFYNLWSFNYIIAFVALSSIGKSFYGFVLFLMQRLFEILGLFLISPLSVGLMPLDNGDSLKQWRTAFIVKFALLVIMVLSLNLVTPLVAIGQNIKLFGTPLVDYIVTTFFLIAALNAISSLNSMFTKIFTGDDKNWGQVENAAKGIQGSFSQGLGKALAGAKIAAAPVSLANKALFKGARAGFGAWNRRQNQNIEDRENAYSQAQLQARQNAYNTQMQQLNANQSQNQADLDTLNADSQMYADYNQQRGRNAKQMHTAAGQADMATYLQSRGYSQADAQAAAARLAAREQAAIQANTVNGKMQGSIRTAMENSFNDERNSLSAQQASIQSQIQAAQSSFEADKQTIETNRQNAINTAINNRFGNKLGRGLNRVGAGLAKVGEGAGKLLKPYGASMMAITGFNPYTAPKDQDLSMGGLVGGTVYTMLPYDQRNPYARRDKK